jgi:hypothetical protein
VLNTEASTREDGHLGVLAFEGDGDRVSFML